MEKDPQTTSTRKPIFLDRPRDDESREEFANRLIEQIKSQGFKFAPGQEPD